MVKRVLIVGAGPGGLATAILLAQAGLQVQILERLPRVGGRTSILEAAGFHFDLGLTFFLYPRILTEIYAAAGYDLHQEIALVRLDPQYRLVFGAGGELHATPVLERMEQEIARLAPQDALSLRRFLADNRTKLERLRPCLETPFLGWRNGCTACMLRVLPLLRPWGSLDRELRTYFQDPRVRLAFAFQATYLGMSPLQGPRLCSIPSFLEYAYGVYHPLGGCGAVTASMARVAAGLGVDVRLNESVTSLLFQGRRAVGVRTAHGVYRADAVVLNADFAQAMTTLVPDTLRQRWTDRRIAGERFSCSTFMLYLGVQGRYSDLPHHTIYLARDYLTNLEDIERRHVLSPDPSFYVQNACVTDPTLASPGMSTLYVLVPVTHQHPQVDWQRERKPYRNLILRHLARVGLEDVERRIRFEHIVTPADWQARYAIYRGVTFNLTHNLRQMLHRRPRHRFEDLDAVYLVGGGTPPGSGLPGICESARITARLVLEDAGLTVPWLAPATGQLNTATLGEAVAHASL
jgi:phytoene desaturase